eukprot:scpid16682/ scgid5307/ Kinesin-like protein KIF3A; Microtubule plus end-directed kinesin motor 3A
MSSVRRTAGRPASRAALERRRTVEDGIASISGLRPTDASTTRQPLGPVRQRSGSLGSGRLERPGSALSMTSVTSQDLRSPTPGPSAPSVRSSSRSSGNTAKSFKTNFCVTVRVRPALHRELQSKGVAKCVEVVDENNALVIRKPKERGAGAAPALLDVDDFGERLSAAPDQLNDVHSFTYDRIYGMSSTQEEVYADCARDIVHSVLKGYNGSIIAYGQTSTGKTHTIEGGQDAEKRGIIPRCCAEIFNYIQNQASHSSKFLVRTSFLEIYNEHVMDLLEPARSNLKVRETPSRGMYVEGLSEKVVRSPSDVLLQLQKGSNVRTTHSTRMNKVSSRSHAVFTMIVEQAKSLGAGKGNDVTIGKLRLVDLAGSERFESDAKGRHIEETKNINTSLYTFGKVILELTTPSSKYIPYRDSKLTRILQDSLGGNCKTTMISTISPMTTSYSESLNTLKFAQRAKLVKNMASVNKDTAHQAMISNYEKEIQRLRQELDSTKSTNMVDRGEVLQLEKEHQQAQEEKDAAVRRLNQQQKEINQAESDKRAYLQKISDLEQQVLQGGTSIEETPEFQEAVRKEHQRLQVEAREKMMKLDLERRRLEKEKEEFEQQKKLLATQNVRSAPDGGRSDEEDTMESASGRWHSKSRFAKPSMLRSPSPESVHMYPAGGRMVVGASTTSSSSLRSTVSDMLDGGPSVDSLRYDRSQGASLNYTTPLQADQQYRHQSRMVMGSPEISNWLSSTGGDPNSQVQWTAELLEYAHALSHPATGIPTQNHPLGVRVFSSENATRWFLTNMEGILNLPAAQSVGQRLISLGIIHSISATPEFTVSASELYYFAEQAEHPQVRRRRGTLQPSRGMPQRPIPLDTSASNLSLISTTSSRRSFDRQPSASSRRSAHSFAETIASSGSNDSNASLELVFEELRWSDYGRSPIHTAAALGDRPALTRHIKELSANSLDSSNRTPLMYAAASNQVKISQLLLHARADQNIAADDKMTPLLVAAKFGHDSVLKYLLKHYRASSLATDMEGKTVLHHCAVHSNTRCLESALGNSLVQRSINDRDQSFQTPLHCAVAAGNVRSISALLAAKADPGIGDDRELTPLHYAVRGQQQAGVEAILKHWQGHLGFEDVDGRTPLQLACSTNAESIAALLLDSNRCNVNHQDKAKTSALHLAVQCANIPLVQLLLSYGAKVVVRDYRGRIPLHYAQEQRNSQMVALLQKPAAGEQRKRPA